MTPENRSILILFAALTIGVASDAASQDLVKIHLLNNSQQTRGEFGESVAGGRDCTGDGIADYLIGHAGYRVRLQSGADGSTVWVYGGSGGYSQEPGVAVCFISDIDGDGVCDILAGAPNAGRQFQATGRVYLLSGVSGALIYEVDGLVDGEGFGASLAAVGDQDGDSIEDFVAGAPWSGDGNARLFSGSTGTKIVEIPSPGGAEGENFGYSIAQVGDLTGDGCPEVLIGDPSQRYGTSNDGGAHLMSLASGAVSVMQSYRGSLYSEFGYSVAGLQDLNGDNVPEFAIGAPGTGSGSFHESVFLIDGTTLDLIMQIKSPIGSTQEDRFGNCIAGIDDQDQDGVGDLVVGAPYTSRSGHVSAGRVYVYSGVTGDEFAQFQLMSGGDTLGHSISRAGDIDHDGIEDFVCSAIYRATSTGYGSVFVVGTNPYFEMTKYEASAGTGASIDLELDFPEPAAGYVYKLLLSATGKGPTTYGVAIPLTRDSLTDDSYAGRYPMPVHNGLHGVLDAAGDAVGSFDVPSGLPASMIGRTFFLAAIANPNGALPKYASEAQTLTIVP